jgi:hypothetical protein
MNVAGMRRYIDAALQDAANPQSNSAAPASNAAAK